MKKTNEELDKLIKKNWHLDNYALAELCGVGETTIRRHARKLGLVRKSLIVKPTLNAKEQIEVDKKKIQHSVETGEDKKKYKLLLKENEKLQKILSVKEVMDDYKPVIIKTKKSNKDSESTAFVLASDWHLEQRVDPNKIMYPNEYNLEIAKQRAEQFFQNTLKLLQKEQDDTIINTLVLWLGGDFITGNIHTENLKVCLLGPSQAVCFARDLLISGIEYLLENTKVDIVIPYNHGNHARITDKVWKSTEEDNSLEYILYDDIAFHFKGNRRIKMIPPKGSVVTIEVYGLKIGFVHGHHGFRYMDGVGGLYIPARKYIMRKFRKANYYLVCMGHHHQYLQDTMFLCNGSMIGYDQYADSCGFDFDIPKQTFFLISEKRKCRTVTTPILFDV